jgi:hypothetical protein
MPRATSFPTSAMGAAERSKTTTSGSGGWSFSIIVRAGAVTVNVVSMGFGRDSYHRQVACAPTANAAMNAASAAVWRGWAAAIARALRAFAPTNAIHGGALQVPKMAREKPLKAARSLASTCHSPCLLVHDRRERCRNCGGGRAFSRCLEPRP